MSSDNPNPYQSPLTQTFPNGADVAEHTQLASRLTRLGGRLIDSVIGLVLGFPVMFATGYFQRIMEQKVGLVEIALYTVGGFIAYVAIHGYFLATRGQTFGKMAVGVRIVDYKTGELVSLAKLIGLRDLPITAIAMIPFIGGFLALIDILFIFSSEKRCIHDLIAGTKVVVA